ncbi:MAG: hypothetical protein ACOC2Z_14845, partial [Coleofasciculus sp.]
ETPVQRTVIDGNANSSVEDKTDTPTQPPSRGIQKPLFRGLSHVPHFSQLRRKRLPANRTRYPAGAEWGSAVS